MAALMRRLRRATAPTRPVATPVSFDPSTLDADTLRRLTDKGHLVLVEEDEKGLRLVTGGALVHARPSDVWKLVTDYERYPRWMPQTADVREVRREGSEVDVAFRLEFRFGAIAKTVRYTLRKTETPQSQVSWTLLEGEFDSAQGMWNLVPVDDGSSTLVFYSTRTDLASMGWIVKKLLAEQPPIEVAIESSTVSMVIKALKAELEP